MALSFDRIATHTIAAEGDSKWTFFDGNYQEYEADKKADSVQAEKPLIGVLQNISDN